MDQHESKGLRGDYLILFQTIILPVTFVITYIIATSLDHVEKEFPYISDTGTWPPESCVFGILLCFYSLTTLLTAHIRWRVIDRYSNYAKFSPRLNNIAFGTGLTAAFGVLLVANFQETSLFVVHLIGALMAFFVGTIYMWLQTVLSWRTPSVPGFIKNVLFIRLLLSFLTTLSVLFILPFAEAANNEYTGNSTKSSSDPGSGKWNPHLGGYDFHITSTSFEWALAGFISLYFLSFVREFRFVHFGMPQLRHNESTNQSNGKNYGSAVVGVDNHGAVTKD